jgi:peptidylprolyl isomerase
MHDLKEGTGATPVRGSKVTVHYTGWLTDGTQFDSSVGRGKPFDFRLETGSVIQGWHQGVAGMKVGGHRQLVIPSDLAYGDKNKGKIPPNSTLIFEIQLLDVGDVRVPPEAMPTNENWTNGEDGLQYVDLTAGSGKEIVSGSVVKAEVTMWLDNGEYVFSTYQGEQPIPFIRGSNRIIPGWDLGSHGMKMGGSRLLRIPPQLAFGDKGKGKIEPNATIRAQIDIIEVGDPRHVPEVMPTYNKADLQSTASGLQYIETAVGTGGTVTAGQMVSVEYTGWLDNGTMFDSSFKTPEAIQFPIGKGRVIKGWDEGVGGMQVGGKRLLVIPPDLAYGDRGSPPVIPPASTLIFAVELIAAE